jgi:adenylate cyclase
MEGAPPEPTVDDGVSADGATGAPAPDWTPSESDPQWRDILEGTAGGFGSGRRFLRHIPASPRCKLCAAPFAGPGAPVMRLFDRGPWDKNPSICGFCFKQLERGRGGAEIDLTLLFADIRGSTTLAESMGPAAFHRLMDRFYHEMTEVLIAHDAVVDKFVGDEVVALFIPALTGADHAGRAVAAAREMLRATGHGDKDGPWAPLGIGIHTGPAYVGTIGDAVTDFTALGDTVNVAARLASAAAGGEILISDDASTLAGLQSDLETRHLTLRGRQQPLDVHVLRS